MNITKATVLYFTGRGTTKRYAKAFAEALPYECSLEEIRHDAAIPETFSQDELLVLAGPVYAGFLPPFVWERLKTAQGNKTPAVSIAVYGARDYDNALLEMDHKLSNKGFVSVGAAAVVARHSIATTIAADRPNDNDIAQIHEFAQTIANRLSALQTIDDMPHFSFKGTLEGSPHKGAVPQTNDECDECGICAQQCPAGAIPEEDPSITLDDLCVSCARCVEICPQQARSLPSEVVSNITAKLQAIADPQKPNKFF